MTETVTRALPIRPRPAVIVGWVLACLACAVGAQAQSPPASGSPGPSTMARTVRIASPSLETEYTFAVLLPTSYATSTRRYPVLYLLHGSGQNHAAFPSRTWFTKEAASREMIVVLPNGGRSFFANSVGIPNARYEDVIVKDLLEYVDTHYRTVATREARAIAGISMGGFGSALLGLRHPDLFGTVGPLSAPLTAATPRDGDDSPSTRQVFGVPGSPERLARDPLTLVTTVVAGTAPYFYVACGRQDPLLQASREFAALLTERGLAHQYVEVPGGHTWAVWDPQLLAFFDVLASRPGWAAR